MKPSKPYSYWKRPIEVQEFSLIVVRLYKMRIILLFSLGNFKVLTYKLMLLYVVYARMQTIVALIRQRAS